MAGDSNQGAESEPTASRNEDDADGLSRRAILTGSGLAALGVGAYLYLDDGQIDSNVAQGDGDRQTVFDVWASASEALQASPDHYPGTAARLVEEGDAKRLFEFVRDEIHTQPARAFANGGFVGDVNGGPRAALRTGMGTPREKAELLATLLERAGYEAEVVQYKRPLADDRPADLFFGGSRAAFDPDEDVEQFAEWRRQLGVTDDQLPDLPVIDEGGDQSRALAETVSAALPDGAQTESSSFETQSNVSPTASTGPGVPVVRFRGSPEPDATTTQGLLPGGGATTRTEDSLGEPPSDTTTSDTIATTASGPDWRYADLFHADESFGTISTPRKIEPVDEPASADVTVTLEAATTDEPNQRMELISKTWDATEVAGRDVAVRMLPGLSPFDHPATRITDVAKFVPALSVLDPSTSQATLEPLSATAGAVSVTGDRYTVGEEGQVKKNGEVIVEGSQGGAEDPTEAATTRPIPDAAERVESLEVSAAVGGYPQVGLKVKARDGDGDPIQQLPARAFETTEEGEAVAAEMEADTNRPRVLVYYDTSLSVELHGFYEDDRKQFRQRMREDIEAINPDASVRFEEASSNAWKYMAKAATQDANLIVYLSDSHGYGTDKKTPERVTAIEEGPPAIMLSVTGTVYDSQQEMADLSGGTAIAKNSSAETRAVLQQFVEDLQPTVPSYTFTYRTPNRGNAGSERSVSVSLPAADTSAETTYTVPEAPIDPRSQRAFCSLFLRVTVGNHTAERTLAGWDPTIDSDREPNESDRKEVLSTFLGGHVLSFETAGVSPSVHVDESLAGKRSLKRMQRARTEATSHAEIKEAVRAGESSMAEHPSRFHPPLPDLVTEDTLTYTTGLRTVLYGQRLVIGTDRFEKSIDVLKTGETRTITKPMLAGEDDRERAFRLTTERTARLAVLERELFDTSTAALLSGAELVPAGEAGEQWDDAVKRRFEAASSRSAYTGYDHRLVDRAGSTAAFWSIDTETGELRGVLPDGSGGGKAAKRVTRTIKMVTVLASTWNVLLATAESTVSGSIPGGTSISIVASYFILLAKLYGIATVSLATTTAGNLTEEAKRAIAIWVCNAAVGLALGTASTAGELADYMNNLHGVAKGSTAFGCGDVVSE